jgi:hypothetical protein
VLTRDHNLPGGVKLDAAAFNSADAVVVTVDGAALANATSVDVEALSGALPAGALVPLGAANSKKFLYLSAAAEAGATTLAVQPLATALAGGEVGYYNAPGAKRRVANGTVVGWTHAEMEAAAASGLLIGPAADADDVVRIILFDVPDVDKNPDAELYRQGSLVKVNFLPGWDTLSSAVKTKIRAQYETTVGGPGAEVPAS